MTLYEHLNRKIPEYYPTMYMDGHKPEEIRFALKRKMLEDREARKEVDESQSVKIVSEVKLR
jgi:hypothetical protein